MRSFNGSYSSALGHTCWFFGKRTRGADVCFVRTWSHQHSEKLGNWCSRLYSRNSNMTLIIMHIHQSRIISVWGRQRGQKWRVSRRWRTAWSGRRSAGHPRKKLFIAATATEQTGDAVSYKIRVVSLLQKRLIQVFAAESSPLIQSV